MKGDKTDSQDFSERATSVSTRDQHESLEKSSLFTTIRILLDASSQAGSEHIKLQKVIGFTDRVLFSRTQRSVLNCYF